MAKRKKRNNIVQHRDWFYCRLRWYNECGRQVECKVNLFTKNKGDAINRAKVVLKEIENIKDGTIQRFQFDEYFRFMNDEGTSELIDMKLETIIPDYLAYKLSKQRASSVNRDRISLNQLCEFIGYSKPIAELNYLDIEGKNGLINHLQNKGYSNNGINITLRHLRAFFNYCHKKAKLIDEPIEFDMLPADERECFIDEYQIQAVHDYIDDERNGIDSFFKRCYIFYEFTGVRAIEPFIGELYGDWLFVDAFKSKGRNLRKIQLSEDLKAILLEMQAFRDGYIKRGSQRPNEASYERISKVLNKICRIIWPDTPYPSNRKITLKSFRHHYGIKRVYITGNIFQVAMEMGHKNVTTTQQYLRFQPDEIKQHFPSLTPIIESMENMPINQTRATKTRATFSSNINKLRGLTR